MLYEWVLFFRGSSYLILSFKAFLTPLFFFVSNPESSFCRSPRAGSYSDMVSSYFDSQCFHTLVTPQGRNAYCFGLT